MKAWLCFLTLFSLFAFSVNAQESQNAIEFDDSTVIKKQILQQVFGNATIQTKLERLPEAWKKNFRLYVEDFQSFPSYIPGSSSVVIHSYVAYEKMIENIPQFRLSPDPRVSGENPGLWIAKVASQKMLKIILYYDVKRALRDPNSDTILHDIKSFFQQEANLKPFVINHSKPSAENGTESFRRDLLAIIETASTK